MSDLFFYIIYYLQTRTAGEPGKEGRKPRHSHDVRFISASESDSSAYVRIDTVHHTFSKRWRLPCTEATTELGAFWLCTHAAQSDFGYSRWKRGSRKIRRYEDSQYMGEPQLSEASFSAQRRVLKPNARPPRCSRFNLFFSMARLSLIAFLAFTFSGVSFAAPRDLGTLEARNNQKFVNCGTWVIASRNPPRRT